MIGRVQLGITWWLDGESTEKANLRWPGANKAYSPSLVGNLWDVTDRDIDRLSEHVLKHGLHLDAAHQPQSRSRANTLLPLSELSTAQAVNKARNECKLKYLNGAAPVVYGLPVYLH